MLRLKRIVIIPACFFIPVHIFILLPIAEADVGPLFTDIIADLLADLPCFFDCDDEPSPVIPTPPSPVAPIQPTFPTIAPILAPTPFPTLPIPPSPVAPIEPTFPTIAPVLAPTIPPPTTPSPTPAPTPAPTSAPIPAPTVISGSSDACENAISVQPGESVSGSTVEATRDNLGMCGSAVNTAPGVWYTVIGTGNILKASTCTFSNYDSQVSVFSGSCSSLSCIDGRDSACGSFLYSQVVWTSQLNVEYKILVHGFRSNTGDFVLDLEENTAPPNNDCTEATMIVPGQSISGSTTFASVDNNIEVCGTAADSTAPGIWYTIVGNGNTLEISTCPFSTFNSQLSVYTGQCGNLNCVAGSDFACGSFLYSQIVWETTADVMYYIFVRGIEGDFERGDFTIDVEELVLPVNNNCLSATVLPIGGNDTGTTLIATWDDMGVCGSAHNTAPGVWYLVLGNGNTLRANTCTGSNYDSQISVFRGFSCNDLVCVGGSNVACGSIFFSEVEWESVLNEPYYILVHGWGSRAGDFTIAIEEDV